MVEGVSGKGLRFNNGQSMTIGKTPATSELKCDSPVTTFFWLKLAANPDELDTLLDMTDNTRPIEQSGFGYRLQVNRERKLVFSLKSADGNSLTRVCEKPGALPLNQWVFVAVRYGDEYDVSITAVSLEDLKKGPAAIAENSEAVQASGKLIFTAPMLPRMGSNADASGGFLKGTIDEVGQVRGYISDRALLDACESIFK